MNEKILDIKNLVGDLKILRKTNRIHIPIRQINALLYV